MSSELCPAASAWSQGPGVRPERQWGQSHHLLEQGPAVHTTETRARPVLTALTVVAKEPEQREPAHLRPAAAGPRLCVSTLLLGSGLCVHRPRPACWGGGTSHGGLSSQCLDREHLSSDTHQPQHPNVPPTALALLCKRAKGKYMLSVTLCPARTQLLL